MKRYIALALPLAAFISGCAPYRYHAKPISPQAMAASLETRSLDAPALRSWMQETSGYTSPTGPAQSWNLKMLTLAAIYYSPALQQARSQVSAARAAVVTSGERPNPTFHIQPGIPSPYLFAFDFLFPIRTAGRRGIMVQQAKDLTLAAKLNLAQATWQVCSNVRAALVSYFVATREVELLQVQQRLQAHRVTLLRQRFAAGEISRPVVSNARLSLLQAHVRLEAAEGRIPEARAALAASIGVPVTALKGIHFAWPDFSHPPSVRSISSQHIQREAVLNRLDVRKALAQYAAAQFALQLEVARQYPDFQLGPGYDFEEGRNFFTLASSLTLPIFNRNQGPIAQAEAQRKVAAAAFLATQANAIAQSEEALAHYRSAWRDLNASEQALTQLERGVIPRERSTVAAGETGHLALNAVLMQRPAMAQTWLTALGRAQAALGVLEDAVERPLVSDEIALKAQSSNSAEVGSDSRSRGAHLKSVHPENQKGMQ